MQFTKKLGRLSAFAASFLFAGQLFAAEVNIEITGTIDNPTVGAELFGQTVSSFPFELRLTVDDALATEIPAGTEWDVGLTFANDMTAIPLGAILSSELAIGNATWSEMDIFESSLPALELQYALLVEGGIDGNNGSPIYAVAFNVDVGSFNLGQFDCATPDCVLSATGSVFDIGTSAFGNMINLGYTVTRVEEEPPTLEELVQDLVAKIQDLGLQGRALDRVLQALGNNLDKKRRTRRLLRFTALIIKIKKKKGQIDAATADELLADIANIRQNL